MKSRGNIVIVVLFMLLMSVSSLALLTHSLLHSRIISARREKWQRSGELEQVLLLRLHHYRQRLDDSDMNQFSAPESDFFNKLNFPDSVAGVSRVSSHFSRQTLVAGGGFSRIRIGNRLTAGRPESRLEYHGLASVDLLQGDIPLNEFPVLLNKKIAGTQAAYLAVKGVEWTGQALLHLPGKPVVAGDGRSVLVAVLGLSGPLPDWRQIREKFFLEPSDAPIPTGIYLALGAGLVEAIYVEGDLQQLQFGALEGLQSIAFEQDGRSLELSYRPGQRSLLWNGPEVVSGYGFVEKIVVHGNIAAVTQSKGAAFATDARIQVMASGKITVCSGLVGENLGLQKAQFAHLLLMTENKDFFSGAEVNADIVLAPGDGSAIEAHIVAAGNVLHGDGLLKLSGSLIVGDIENSGRLQFRALAGRFDFPAHRVLKNYKCLQNFRVHYITEGSDE